MLDKPNYANILILSTKRLRLVSEGSESHLTIPADELLTQTSPLLFSKQWIVSSPLLFSKQWIVPSPLRTVYAEVRFLSPVFINAEVRVLSPAQRTQSPSGWPVLLL
jgi:hypothetical protein